jgi:plasmid stabilization system protein ParE
MDEVRRAVDAQLASEEQFGASPIVPSPRRELGDTPGMMPPNPRPGWPLTPAARQLASLRTRAPRHRQPPRIQRVRHQNRSSRRTIVGVAGVVAVLTVLVVIVVTIISSFADTIATLFH